MQVGYSVRDVLPVSSIMLGFLFAGFWWTLDRELAFKAEDRHFKFGIGMLLVAMILLAVFGVALPLGKLADEDQHFLLYYRGVVLALITVFGYMLTDLGHYGVFKAPRYKTKAELFWLVGTVVVIAGCITKWCFS